MKPVKTGVIGCGYISGIYLRNSKLFESFEVTACADLIPERAKKRAEEFSIPKACSVGELLNDPSIELLVNLTTPDAHYNGREGRDSRGQISLQRETTGDKPTGRRGAAKAAKEKEVLLGGAPDTFMGGGIQTCRKLIDDGLIGEPIAATAFMTCHGHESWHPDPEFYYKVGGGPMFDMGPYYLTTLVNLIGPMESVKASARITFPERTITSEPKRGTSIKVEVPTHVAGVIDFQNGAVGTIIMSFDVWAAQLPRIEIYGSTGTLSVPDPNTFDGPVKIFRQGDQDWSQVPLTHGYTSNSRGLGVADMAYAIRSGREHRANGQLTYHVLEAMHAFHQASHQEKTITLKSTCRKPAPLPLGLHEGSLSP